MKKILFLLLLFANSVLAQNVTGYMTVNVPGAASTQALKDSLRTMRDSFRVHRIAILKAAAGIGLPGPKGDKGDVGPQGPPGKDASGSGTVAGSLFSMKSIKEFGAQAFLEDNSAAIQATIDYCRMNNVRVVFIPWGIYKYKKSLIVMNPNAFVTLEILGESSFWDSNIGSVLYYTGTDGFGIGIQNGKGCKIRKITLNSVFNPPFVGDRNKFFASAFDDFKDNICRDSRQSPHVAIAIDPFTNLPGQMPTDGGYPQLKSYYGLSPNFSTQTGSTGTVLEELSINNYVGGIISSPNGYTRNAEISIFRNIQFENLKFCIANCQDQEKANLIDGIYCWGNTHTIFISGVYGSGRMAGNYWIDHANIAGAVVQFIYNDQHGYFPTYISHIFAESLGMWGTVNSELACSISDSHIDFANTWEGNDITKTLITSYGEGVVYRSCNFRIYDGTPHDIKVEGSAYWDHCNVGLKNVTGKFNQ